MSETIRYPKLDKIYQQYLEDENSAEFIRLVSESYNIGAICRLADCGQTISRRAAVLTLGFLGGYSENEIMGRALIDSDRAVRLLADHGIRELWSRQGCSRAPGSCSATVSVHGSSPESRGDRVGESTSVRRRNTLRSLEPASHRTVCRRRFRGRGGGLLRNAEP